MVEKKEGYVWLLPILFLLGVLPFVTKFIVYDCGLSQFSWFPANGNMVDFYVYFKSRYFQFTLLLICFLLPIYLLYNKPKKAKSFSFVLLLGYLFLVIGSAIFTKNKELTRVGLFDHFENIFVLAGYPLLCYYTYQVVRGEKSLKAVTRVLFVVVVLMGVIGIYQWFTGGLLHNTFLQRLVMSPEDFSVYEGKLESSIQTGALSLTLDNPNYAGVYLSMLLSFFTAILLFLKKKMAILAFLITGFLLVLTYSRTSVLAFLIAMLVLAILQFDRIKNKKKEAIKIVIGLACFFLLADSFNGFHLLKRFQATIETLSTKEQETLKEILTLPEGIQVVYGNHQVLVEIGEEEKILVKGEEYENWLVADFQMFQGKKRLCLTMEDKKWFFEKQKEGYCYINEFGKQEQLTPIPKVNFHGLEKFASNRGYIWSRTLPLLKNTILLGSGAETYPILFPQNDRVGKYNYCKNVYTMIENPHSLYLSIGTQAGLLSLLLFLGFYFCYFVKSVKIYKKRGQQEFLFSIGLGFFLMTITYMVCGLFVDSSIQTSPLFWISMGLGMSVNEMIVRLENRH